MCNRDDMLTVVAEMTSKPGREAELTTELLAMVEATRQEEGCVQYDLHVSTANPGSFVFYENWASQADLDRHAESSHIQVFLLKAPALLAEPVRVLTYTRIA
jgi:quinol monooxygenase YgiN